MVEQRRFARAPLNQPVVIRRKGSDGDALAGAGLRIDISLGGMFIETATPAPFGAEVVIITPLGDKGEFALPGVVRWTKPTGMGIQFGLLGARETHVITEITREAEASEPR